MTTILVLIGVAGVALGQQPPASNSSGNHALVVGGGCETVSSSNTGTGQFCDAAGKAKGHWSLFRPSFDATVSALRANGWDTGVQYDSDTWERPWAGAVPFTKKALFDALKDRIKNAKSGEQFLLSIDTHGSTDPHAICLGDGSLIRVSELTSYLKKLKDKGVKVAVVDSSCYSGNSVKEFSSTGACVMSGSPPNVTGSGDTIVPYLFGLGLPKGAAVPSYYTTKISDASADLNGDGRISAAEAFAFARLHMDPNEIPVTSDCALGAEGIRGLLDSTAPVLRTYGVMRENLRAEREKPSHSDACEVAALGESFYRLASASVNQATLIKVDADLATLGDLGGMTLLERAKRLRLSTENLARIISDGVKDQDEADRLISEKQPVPTAVKDRLTQADKDVSDARRAVFKDLRPLVQLACEHEKVTNPGRARPCESFDLFPKRSGT